VSKQEPTSGGSAVDDGGSVVVVVVVVVGGTVVVVVVVGCVVVVVGGTVVVVVVGGCVVVVVGGCVVVVVVGSGPGAGVEAGCEAGSAVETSAAGAGAAVVRADGEMNGNVGSVGWDCAAVESVVGAAELDPAMVVVVVVTGGNRGSDAGARGFASADGTSRGAPGRLMSISWTTTRTPPTRMIAARSSFIFMRTTRSSRSSSACSSISALHIPAVGRARATAYAHAYGFSPIEFVQPGAIAVSRTGSPRCRRGERNCDPHCRYGRAAPDSSLATSASRDAS
jgi:hypothetical protein